MAARSLIQLFRQTNPSLLHKKDRGRPTEAAPIVLEYGESRPANEYVPGAEVMTLHTLNHTLHRSGINGNACFLFFIAKFTAH